MDLLQSFLQHLRQPEPSAPRRPELPVLTSLVSRLWALLQQARLPLLSEDEMRRLAPMLDPELRAIVSDCAELLARLPALGEPVGLTAPFLRELLQLDLQLSRLLPVAEDLGRAAARATSARWGGLGAWNARVLLAVQEMIADQALPLAERHGLQVQFRGALGEAERMDAARDKGGKAVLRKAEALKDRIEAAGRSQAVKDALALLQRAAAGPRP